MQRILPFFGLILLSCGGGASDDSNMDLTPVDTLIEHEINDDRITAVEFNNELSLMQNDVLDLMDTLFSSQPERVESNLEDALFEIEIFHSKLNEMEFDGSEKDFLDAMIALMEWYKSELNSPFRDEIVPVMKSPKSLIDGTKEKATYMSYNVGFAAKEKEYFDAVFEAQEAFAKANNIRLEVQ